MADEAEKGKAEIDKAETDKDVTEKPGLSTMKIVILAVLVASVLSGGMVGLTMFLLSDDDSESVTAAKTDDQAEQDDDDAEEDEDEGEGEGEGEGESVQGPPIYHRMDPKFVVSFRDQKSARFMQFSIQIMTRDKKVIEQIKEHNPVVRSNLLLLFDNQTADAMSSREGKELLLQQITEDINRSLEALVDITGVEAAYFESFLIQ